MLSLEEVLTSVGFTPAEQARVRNHELVRGVHESTNERELAARFAFSVQADPSELRAIFLVSSKRQQADPTVLQMGNIEEGDSNPFASLKLEPNGSDIAKAYLTAKPGSCSDLNLSESEMKLFAALPSGASQSDVEEKLRDVLYNRLQSYKQKGLKGISPYCRGKVSYEPGEELYLKSEVAPVLQKAAPKFHRCLLDYPLSKPEDLEESFSWVNFKIDEKPTIALVHKMGLRVADVYVFCQRHFYVSRGHNSIQGLGGAFPVESKEVVVIYGSRTSTDQVTGFGGAAKRAMGSRIMGGRIAENMENFRKLAKESSTK